MYGEKYSSFVSQKNWSEKDKFVACTVECNINNIRHQVILIAEDPMDAINKAQKFFNKLNWEKKLN